jgi:hypothetical protein
MIASSVTSTLPIRDSTLTAVLMPSLDNRPLRDNQTTNVVQFSRAETMVPCQRHRPARTWPAAARAVRGHAWARCNRNCRRRTITALEGPEFSAIRIALAANDLRLLQIRQVRLTLSISCGAQRRQLHAVVRRRFTRSNTLLVLAQTDAVGDAIPATPTPPTSPSAGRWSDALRRRTARTRHWRR